MSIFPNLLSVPLKKRYRKISSQVTNQPPSVYGLKYDIWREEIPHLHRNLIVTERYETDETQLVREYLHPDFPAIELGGCFGIVSCVIAKTLNNQSQVVLEPNPELSSLIEYQRDLNKFDFDVRNTAYHPYEDRIYFTEGEDATKSNISELSTKGSIETEAVSILDIWSDSIINKEFSLVCDIEGAETLLFQEEMDFLEDRCRGVVVELHPNLGDKQQSMDAIEESEFDIVDRSGETYVLRNPQLTDC